MWLMQWSLCKTSISAVVGPGWRIGPTERLRASIMTDTGVVGAKVALRDLSALKKVPSGSREEVWPARGHCSAD